MDAVNAMWHGARRHSTNVAELAGILMACRFVRNTIPRGTEEQIAFDSSSQPWRARSNVLLVRTHTHTCAKLVEYINDHDPVSWKWMGGHSRNQWKEWADANAELGASGRASKWHAGTGFTGCTAFFYPPAR